MDSTRIYHGKSLEWTASEIRTLRYASAVYKTKFITELLPERSVGAIRKKMQRLGLSRKDDIKRIIQENHGKSIDELSDIAICDKRTIRRYLI